MDVPERERRRLRVGGLVQGVGFRPFVSRLASANALGGFALNDGHGVLVEIEGPPERLDAFAVALVEQAPPHAHVRSVAIEPSTPLGATTFEIRPSLPAGDHAAPIPPDIATCDDCLRELFDPDDRRYRYPFLSCSSCGPRFTIVTAAPYDRARTTMAAFALCVECRREYEDTADRRFHAEPIACPACGPQLTAPLSEAVSVLRNGGIVAVKGLGGYHLSCDATSAPAVARLRERKHREEKPLAVMTGDPGPLAFVDRAERELLHSPARPIVLVRRRPDAGVAPGVAPGSPWLGLLLPYTPLHHLLLADTGVPLVMTSGNRTDEPIAIDDADARARLGDVADLFLSHDRSIHRRCEDSVVRASFPIRRSRGYAPGSLRLPIPAPRPLVAAGAELKSTFCVAHGAEAHLSGHLGDLDTEQAYRAYLNDLELTLQMLQVVPEAVACDMHPDYRASAWARRQELELVEVQHHHAHAAACLAEHGETGDVLAVVLDGTGYGPDGTLWGGEVLRCDLITFARAAWLEPVPLPGGEAAVREPWRVAAAHLEREGRPVPWERWGVVRESLRAHAPLSSGAGRLLDAVAALLGVRERVSYEGQAAIELEYLAGATVAQPYACRIEHGVIHGGDLVTAAADDLTAGRPRAEIAAAAHEGLAAAFVRACADAGGSRTAVLAGGCLQNLRLAASLTDRLEREGFRVLRHRRLPPNDGIIALGQAAVAAARMSSCA
ncbi:MAG: carbamoyltransferase HypF [Gaiella sp.]